MRDILRCSNFFKNKTELIYFMNTNQIKYHIYKYIIFSKIFYQKITNIWNKWTDFQYNIEINWQYLY